jgi:chromosomal replication initiation ATPase DnaA
MTPTPTSPGIFTQLAPLLAQRAVLITVSKLDGDQLQVNICPRQLKGGENEALTIPLSVTGTAADLDAFRDADRTLDNFDFAFNPKMNRSLVFDLATAAFINKREDALFLGPGGTGKSHLAQAIGQCAIQQGYKVLYRETHILLDLSAGPNNGEERGGEPVWQ